MEVNLGRKRRYMIPETRLIQSGEGEERVEATPGSRVLNGTAHTGFGAARVI